MGEDKYPYYYPRYVPHKRSMKEVKQDYSNYISKFNSKKLLK